MNTEERSVKTLPEDGTRLDAIDALLDFMDQTIERSTNRVYDWPNDERDLHRSVDHLSFIDRKAAVSRLRAEKIVDLVAKVLRGDPPSACETCEHSGRRCLSVHCAERQDDRHTEWWCDYGCCSRAHAVDYYGEEAIG